MKYLNLVFTLCVLYGCASNKVALEDISQAQDKSNFQSLDNKHKYRLDYLIDQKQYTYTTYEIEHKDRYIELLTENGQFIAASEISQREVYWPVVRKCTLFPYSTKLDVLACLSQFNKDVTSKNDPSLFNNLVNANLDEGNRKNNETAGTLILGSLLSPILVPTAVMAAPMLMYDYHSSENAQEKFNLTLGANDDIEGYLASLDDKFISQINNNGTAYIPSGIMAEPEISFGFINNEIVWLQLNPYWACGGGFMFFGATCKAGWHSK